MEELDKDNIPRHVAIIMDGNGRWARKRLMNRINGHRRGMEAVKNVVMASRELGIKYLTLYAFSTENWRRPKEEVRALMSLLGKYLRSELTLMIENNIKLISIGNIDNIPKDEKEVLLNTIEKTKENKGMVLNLALSYGGRSEILDATRALADEVKKGELESSEIDAELFSSHLLTSEIPDPDLLIRTSGEMRISNFLLWQVAYAELYFTDTLWPDFNKEELFKAIKEYQSRERRFGKTGDQVSPSEVDVL
ncbi:MAG: isoprenyl transferase [Proteobacteria bacterium]|nr:isoprenyl transferase [Pseudomonadota bacterium]